jgi:hypothetical protein
VISRPHNHPAVQKVKASQRVGGVQTQRFAAEWSGKLILYAKPRRAACRQYRDGKSAHPMPPKMGVTTTLDTATGNLLTTMIFK